MPYQDQSGPLSSCTTETPLGANGVFQPIWCAVSAYAAITVTAFSDQVSANDGLQFQWSGNGVDVDLSEGSSVQANTGRAFAITPRAPYFRVRYTNGLIAQTVFRLHVHGLTTGSGLISRPLDKDLTDENFAQTVRATLNARKSEGGYVHVPALNGYPLFDGARPKTFYVHYGSVDLANDRYMATLFNASTKRVCVQTILAYCRQAGLITVPIAHYIAKISQRTAGTNIIIKSCDSQDSLTAGITADKDSTGVTEDHIIKRFWRKNEPSEDQTPVYRKTDYAKGIVLGQNEGITIRNTTNTTDGKMAYWVEFTEEE